jgi:hypothetical protein
MVTHTGRFVVPASRRLIEGGGLYLLRLLACVGNFKL